MTHRPDNDEESSLCHGRLAGKKAVIIGADGDIGRALIDQAADVSGRSDVPVGNAAHQAGGACRRGRVRSISPKLIQAGATVRLGRYDRVQTET